MNSKVQSLPVRIIPFSNEMTIEASHVLARSFLNNPLHIAAFGYDEIKKNNAFFRSGIAVMKGAKFIAVRKSRILGFIHWAASPHCQFSMMEKLALVPQMMMGFGFNSTVKVSKWLAEWSKHDPEKKHIHLGPIGVDPDEQGHGIGRLLMQHYCDELDRTGSEGYLETDRKKNIKFYESFGFRIMGELSVLGVKNYLMWRSVHCQNIT